MIDALIILILLIGFLGTLGLAVAFIREIHANKFKDPR